MNFTHFISHHGKRINREHFLHLVQVAKTDGRVEKTELNLLHKEGKKFGLTDPEIEQLIVSEASHNYHPPYSLEDKFLELYNISEMIIADEIVTDTEKGMIKKYAIAAGFRDEVLENLIELLIKGVREGKEEEDLLAEYRKKYM